MTSKLHTRAGLAGVEVVTLVKRLAKKEHSAVLAQSASRSSAVMRFGSSAGEDPFAKVRALISDMRPTLRFGVFSNLIWPRRPLVY